MYSENVVCPTHEQKTEESGFGLTSGGGHVESITCNLLERNEKRKGSVIAHRNLCVNFVDSSSSNTKSSVYDPNKWVFEQISKK